MPPRRGRCPGACAERPTPGEWVEDPADYAVSFTDEQWQRLEATFPTG